MGHSHIKNFFHIVWTTKKRVPYITNQIKPRLYGYIKGLMSKEEAHLLAIGGIYDHVHMLVQAGGRFQLSPFMGRIKSRSSKFVSTIDGPEDYFAWQEGYHSCTVTPSGIKKVAWYITNQEKRHKDLLYDDEIRMLLQLDDDELIE